MHAIHHTDAFILKTVPTGEANKLVWLFTREFGLVVATVQGVRKSGAKLAMFLSDYALVSVDLIRGREQWRLVSIAASTNPFIAGTADTLGRSYVRTLHAVERFCQGEEAHEELFDHLVSCFDALKSKTLDAHSFDTLSLWKVLVLLGYGVVPDPYQPLFRSPFSDAVKELPVAARTELVRATNDIIKETHL